MVTITEQIDIPAPYEKLEAWADNFQEEFVRWSPYHIECDLYDGGYQTGSKIRFREVVMNLDYNVIGTVTECEQDNNHFRIVFQSDKKTAFITFEGKRTETGCHFSHTEAFGMTTPVIGPIMNFLIFKVFFKKKANWQLIRNDMILDNNYLNDILTGGKYPDRIPLEELLSGIEHS
ncbi:MAG: SRPBCC family protein [Clostridia bacterium]|nr:SRPBCC family protein [Clostridia bacterium]